MNQDLVNKLISNVEYSQLGKADAHASDVVYHNGKFYWYISAEHKIIPGKANGIAVSNSPIGPFTDTLGYALITNDMRPGPSTPQVKRFVLLVLHIRLAGMDLLFHKHQPDWAVDISRRYSTDNPAQYDDSLIDYRIHRK